MTADRTASGARKISQGYAFFAYPWNTSYPPGNFLTRLRRRAKWTYDQPFLRGEKIWQHVEHLPGLNCESEYS